MTPTREPRPLLCPACKAPLAVTSDETLTVGAVEVFDRLMFRCLKCRNVDVWRPGGRRRGEARAPESP